MELSFHRLARGENGKAIEILRRVIKLDGENAPAHAILGLAINRKTTTFPIRKRDSRAHAEERSELIAESDQLFTTAVRLSPNDKYIRLFWAASQFGRSIDNPLLLPLADPEPILNNLRKAQEIDPGDLRIASKLANVLQHYGSTFVFLYAKNPPRLPWIPTGISGQGRIYLREAVALYEDLLQDDPTKSSNYRKYTRSLTGLGRYQEAIVVCKSVIEQHRGERLARDAYRWWWSVLDSMEHHLDSPDSSNSIEKARAEYREHWSGGQD
jgi:tetratricopeptide (TPR) repeat protein